MGWGERMVTNTKNKDDEINNSLQILQTWFSSSFPIGSYAYSHGLEAMIEDKIIKNEEDIVDFIQSIVVHGTCKNDLIFLKSTYEGDELNDLALAMCSSKERKIETLAMGNAFMKILKESWKFELPANMAYPICLGKAGLHFKIPVELTSLFYLQSFTSNLINICVKHVPLGQKIGQDCIVNTMPIIKNVAEKIKDFSLEDLGGICFNADIYSIKHEYLTSRVYLT